MTGRQEQPDEKSAREKTPSRKSRDSAGGRRDRDRSDSTLSSSRHYRKRRKRDSRSKRRRRSSSSRYRSRRRSSRDYRRSRSNGRRKEAQSHINSRDRRSPSKATRGVSPGLVDDKDKRQDQSSRPRSPSKVSTSASLNINREPPPSSVASPAPHAKSPSGEIIDADAAEEGGEITDMKKWEENEDFYDRNEVYNLRLPKKVLPSRYSDEKRITGLDIMDIRLHQVLYRHKANWSLRPLANGKFCSFIVARNHTESTVMSKLLRTLRRTSFKDNLPSMEAICHQLSKTDMTSFPVACDKVADHLCKAIRELVTDKAKDELAEKIRTLEAENNQLKAQAKNNGEGQAPEARDNVEPPSVSAMKLCQELQHTQGSKEALDDFKDDEANPKKIKSYIDAARSSFVK